MTPWVRALLLANVGIYLLQMTLPGLIEPLFAYVPARVLRFPWTIVTYMFLHGSMTHILFNMLGLFFFGSRVEERLGSRRFAWLYFISGISGAILSSIFAPRSPIIGASAGVFGVMLAFAYFWPRDRIYIWGVLPIEARWLVVITTVLALYSGLQGSRGGIADFAHLGGYAGAFLYLRYIERSRASRQFAKQLHAQPPEDARLLSRWRSIDTQRVHEVNRDEVNRILDKISASGLSSLTPQERVFLTHFVPKEDQAPPVS